MNLQPIELGRPRTSHDGCRRYRPIEMTFDSRNVMLDQEIGEDWEPAIQKQWRTNQANIRMGLLAEHGTVDGEAKIANYRAMGPAPWSIVHQHNEVLAQVRSAFTHGDFYPALVGACALGERIFNDLLLELRQDYLNHSATTKRAKSSSTFTDWGSSLQVLRGWGVLDDSTHRKYLALASQRHAAVHFDATVQAVEREPALQAVHALQETTAAIFTSLGGPPTYIDGASGASFLSLAAEETPLIKRVFLPRSALVSPRHRMQPGHTPEGELVWQVLNDLDYDPTPLDDEEFVAALSYV